ncbi:Pycsar system effector family protein [Mucilaginibacter sp. UYCu711]|uniref:Pycsar system effector family protein n=1 Tax=Mucilaginibacter sp. UYCu711 TaxID=3156339 RepID=UPI003D1BCA8C
MKFQQLLEDVKQYVLDYFHEHYDPDLLYHDLNHTKGVVTAATRIANHYQLSDEDFFVVITSAWFHDIGYFTDRANHEAAGARLAAEFLKPLKVSATVVEKISGCIMATKMPQKPTGLLQQIMCDADLFHLGTDDFADKNKQLRKEIAAAKHVDIDKQQWRKKNIELLEAHNYFTDYAQLLLHDKQERNLRKLKEKQADAEKAGPEKNKQNGRVEPTRKEKITEEIKEEKKQKKEKPEKGIETMFRITSGNNQRLSDMADNKAHILITVNSIILSAIISLVLRKLEENSFLAIPSFVLLTVSLLSMIFSILATRPSIPEGTFTAKDIDDKKVNLLFFGNFYKMGLPEYTAGMLKVMDDRAFLYGTLIKDVYSQGVVLGRKYRLLRVAYNIFMFGLIIAVIGFIIASIFRDAPLVRP